MWPVPFTRPGVVVLNAIDISVVEVGVALTIMRVSNVEGMASFQFGDSVLDLWKLLVVFGGSLAIGYCWCS